MVTRSAIDASGRYFKFMEKIWRRQPPPTSPPFFTSPKKATKRTLSFVYLYFQSLQVTMAVARFLFLTALMVLAVSHIDVESKPVNSTTPSDDDNKVTVREKRFVDPLSVIGLVVSVASAIQGAVCTFTDVCGGDELTQKLERLERKLDAIQSDVISIKKDVEDIWDASKRKWYFKHIEYIVNERKKVMQDLKKEDNSALAEDRRQRFINEVAGNDEYVEKGLFHIPTVVTTGGLVTHYFKVQTDNGKSTTEAARLTWRFIRKLFRSRRWIRLFCFGRLHEVQK